MYRKISNRELSEKAATLQALQTEAAALNEQIDNLKAEITTELTRREIEEIKVDGFLLRWTKYITNRFDGRAFKAEYPSLADTYTKQTEARRFTVTAQ